MSNTLSGTLTVIIIIAVIVIFILLLSYVKASPDTAYVISGLRKVPRFLVGKAGIKVPFFEKKDILNLSLISIPVRTSSAVPTADYININVESTVNICISKSPQLLERAAQNFLNRKTDYINSVAREVLEGNIREIVGKMQLKDLVSDRKQFSELVTESAEQDLTAMGLQIVSFNVQNFIDDEKVIYNLGVDNIVKIKKDAAISRANSERDISVAQSQASQDANDARIISEQAIAEKNNILEIKKAELKQLADVKKAQADAAYEIQKEEQRKTLEKSTAEADIVKQEQTIIIKEKEALIKEKELDADIRRKAEADKFKEQQEADAELYSRMKAAEAETYEAKQKAEAEKIKAEAVKYSMLQEAEGIKSKGIAEADAIQAKALAEAEGIDKKAEAMAKMGQASVLEMYFNALPSIAKNVAEPLSKVDKITMFGDGNTSKMTGDIVNSITQISEGLTESMGIDLKTMIAAFLGGKIATKDNVIADNNK